ncbi:MAG: hypothetical protein JW894_01510 [Bacteroidales bacterium]|nr:hypothetical protein [Bacteroidales bacterium]
MKNYKYILFLVLCAITTNLLAQYDYPGEEKEYKKRERGKYYNSNFVFGGNLGLSFGTITYVELSPFVGYYIIPRLLVGLGPRYTYYKNGGLVTNRYGGMVFTQFTVFKNLKESIGINLGDIFIYTENETLSLEPIYVDRVANIAWKGERKWYNTTLVGGGMRIPLGERGGISIFVLFDVIQNPEHHYENPVIRLWFDF